MHTEWRRSYSQHSDNSRITSHDTGRGGKEKRLTDLPVFDDRPLEALHIQTDESQSREQDDGLDTRLLPVVVFWLCGPVEEGDDVLGQLRGGRGRT